MIPTMINQNDEYESGLCVAGSAKEIVVFKNKRQTTEKTEQMHLDRLQAINLYEMLGATLEARK